MNNDDDIPILRDAVIRKHSPQLGPKDIDEICAGINAATSELIDKLLAEAVREAENTLRLQISDRLNDELPALIEKTLQEKLGKPSNK